MNDVTLFSPAKLNLFLAITGRRADRFHDLISVVDTVDFGDELRASINSYDDETTLVCDAPGVPLDETNLVLRAAAAFRGATDWRTGVTFSLTKRVPMGAGLGGGSSNAVAALRALNALAGKPLSHARLGELAAQLGSDCALFLQDAPIVMRGRGERVTSLPPEVAGRLRGRRVLVFKPSVSIGTAWAYARMATGAPGSYLSSDLAEARLRSWLETPGARPEQLLFNNLEAVAFEKYLALPVLLAGLRRDFRVAVGMSGSGSACFALLEENVSAVPLLACIHDAWGHDCFAIETRLR